MPEGRWGISRQSRWPQATHWKILAGLGGSIRVTRPATRCKSVLPHRIQESRSCCESSIRILKTNELNGRAINCGMSFDKPSNDTADLPFSNSNGRPPNRTDMNRWPAESVRHHGRTFCCLETIRFSPPSLTVLGMVRMRLGSSKRAFAPQDEAITLALPIWTGSVAGLGRAVEERDFRTGKRTSMWLSNPIPSKQPVARVHRLNADSQFGPMSAWDLESGLTRGIADFR